MGYVKDIMGYYSKHPALTGTPLREGNLVVTIYSKKQPVRRNILRLYMSGTPLREGNLVLISVVYVLFDINCNNARFNKNVS